MKNNFFKNKYSFHNVKQRKGKMSCLALLLVISLMMAYPYIDTKAVEKSAESSATTEMADDKTTKSTEKSSEYRETEKTTEESTGNSETTTESTGTTNSSETTTESTGTTGSSETTTESAGTTGSFETTTGTAETTTEVTGSAGTTSENTNPADNTGTDGSNNTSASSVNDSTPKDDVILHSIKLFVVNESTGNYLSGAKFRLKKKVESDYVTVDGMDTFTISADGFALTNLEPGQYKLIEVSAPTNYISAEDIEFLVTTDDVKFINNTSATLEKGSDGTYEMAIPNVKGFILRLPSTGGQGTYLYVMSGLVLVMISLNMLLKRRNITN